MVDQGKRQKRIVAVVVDDDPEMLRAIELMLKLSGITVKTAGSGVAGFMLVKREVPDVVVLDIMMPDMDGYDVCRRLKLLPETKDIPIIFLTAKAGNEHMQQGLSLGAQGYISKPFELEELVSKVREVADQD